jgi:hypothetical protein
MCIYIIHIIHVSIHNAYITTYIYIYKYIHARIHIHVSNLNICTNIYALVYIHIIYPSRKAMLVWALGVPIFSCPPSYSHRVVYIQENVNLK